MMQVLNIFSRKHGDLERDYNDFVIEATYFRCVCFGWQREMDLLPSPFGMLFTLSPPFTSSRRMSSVVVYFW